MTPARFRWGMILILFGLVILLINIDVFDDSIWEDLVWYFPFLLIAIGLEKIFSQSKVKAVSYLTTVALAVGVLYVGYSASYGDSRTSFWDSDEYSQAYDDSIRSLRAEVELGETDLTVRDATDRDLVYAQFRRFTSKPQIEYRVEDSGALVRFAKQVRSPFGGIVRIETDDPRDWTLSFSDRVPLTLECQGDESNVHLNMATTPLQRLRLDVDGSYVYVKLGDLLPLVEVSVSGRDSELKLRVPRSSGVRIGGQDLEDYLDRLGYTRGDGYFTSEGYDTLPQKVMVDLKNDLRSLSIDRY